MHIYINSSRVIVVISARGVVVVVKLQIGLGNKILIAKIMSTGFRQMLNSS